MLCTGFGLFSSNDNENVKYQHLKKNWSAPIHTSLRTFDQLRYSVKLGAERPNVGGAAAVAKSAEFRAKGFFL